MTENTQKSSVVDALFDVATQWTAVGLGFGKQALVQAAKTLETTAKSLDELAKSLTAKPESDAPAAK